MNQTHRKDWLKIIVYTMVFFYAAIKLINHFTSDMNYPIKSKKQSPDSKYTIYEFTSLTEGGHAPYGTQLALSKSRIKNPDDGYVIFAGYCEHSIEYSWLGNEKIDIVCKSTQETNIVETSVSMAYGININLLVSPLNQALKAQPAAAGTPLRSAP